MGQPFESAKKESLDPRASYSRTYWRNALNNGLLVLVADTSALPRATRCRYASIVQLPNCA